MRKSELFDAYLSDSLTIEQAEELKKVLATENGSNEFMRYVTESQLLCEILMKKQELDRPEQAKKTFVIPIFIIAAAAALIAIIILLKTPAETSPETTVNKKNPVEKVPEPIYKVYKSSEIKNLVLADGTNVHSQGDGELMIIDRNNVSVKNGLFTFQVKARIKEPPFRIQMSNGSIEVIGTAFDIIDSPQRSSIAVSEGTVRFLAKGKELILHAGDSASADRSALTKSEEKLNEKLELLIDGEYTADKKAFRDASPNNRTGWASWNRGDDGAVKQVLDENNHAIEFTKSGRLGVANFNINGKLTISSWLKPNGTQKHFQTILSNGDSSWRMSFFEDTFKAHFAITGLSPEYLNSKQSLSPKKWSLVTGVYDGSMLKLYINGVLDSEVSVTGTVGQYKGNVEVAGNYAQQNRIFEGTLDGVSVYSRALSDLEVLKLYQNGRP